MNRPAQSFRASSRTAPRGSARIIFLSPLLAFGLTRSSGQDEVHNTPGLIQGTASGEGYSKENHSRDKETQFLKTNVDLVRSREQPGTGKLISVYLDGL